jgi:hypothetical protein
MTADLQGAEFGGQSTQSPKAVPVTGVVASPRRQRRAALASLILRVGLVACGMAVALLLITR